jgi:hypothetical protein
VENFFLHFGSIFWSAQRPLGANFDPQGRILFPRGEVIPWGGGEKKVLGSKSSRGSHFSFIVHCNVFAFSINVVVVAQKHK